MSARATSLVITGRLDWQPVEWEGRLNLLVARSDTTIPHFQIISLRSWWHGLERSGRSHDRLPAPYNGCLCLLCWLRLPQSQLNVLLFVVFYYDHDADHLHLEQFFLDVQFVQDFDRLERGATLDIQRGTCENHHQRPPG